jgi:hypothetical protein
VAFVSTLGATNANSFLSVASATTLLGEIPASAGITAWLALTTTQKEQTLVAATMTINSLKFKGKVATSDQSLSWPRLIKVDGRQLPSDDLPIDFEVAVAYMAAYLGETGGYTAVAENDGGASLLGTNQYEEVDLGNSSLRVKYRDRSGVPQTGINYIPPFVMDILSRYISDPGFNQPYLTRSSTARINPYYGGAFRPNRIRTVGNQVFPASGGWYSNPL